MKQNSNKLFWLIINGCTLNFKGIRSEELHESIEKISKSQKRRKYLKNKSCLDKPNETCRHS